MIDRTAPPPRFAVLFSASDGLTLERALTELLRAFVAGRAADRGVRTLRDLVCEFFNHLDPCPAEYRRFWDDWWAESAGIIRRPTGVEWRSVGSSFLRWLLTPQGDPTSMEAADGEEAECATRGRKTPAEGAQAHVRDDRAR
jgi:hypothetical protein